MAARSTKDEMTYTERRMEVATLYLEGWRQSDLAERFGVNQSTISRDLAAIRQQWLESTLIDFNEAKARELARIDKLEREYWEQYEASKGGRTVATVQEAAGGKRQTVRKETRTGDPRYLSGVQWCIEQRLRIFGLYAPQRTELTGAKGGPVVVVNWEDAGDDND